MAMNTDWNDDEDDFNIAISQRTEELYRIPNADVDEDGCIEALALPLRDLVVFPHMVSPVFVSREASVLAIHEAHRHNQTVIGLTQRDPEQDGAAQNARRKSSPRGTRYWQSTTSPYPCGKTFACI